MGKIATETEARTIGRQGTAETNRMCTKARAIALGCNVASSYSDNQLAQYEHLSKAEVTYNLGLEVANTAAIRAYSYNFQMTTGERFSGVTPTNSAMWMADIRYDNRLFYFGTANSTSVVSGGTINGVELPIGTGFKAAFALKSSVFTSHNIRAIS